MIKYFIENVEIEYDQIRSLCKLHGLELVYIIDYLIDNKIIEENKKNNTLSFHYVGLICIGDLILYILPKYIKNTKNEYINKEHAKVILKVFEKYTEINKKLPNYELETLDFDENNLIYNKVALMKYFINDYMENGLYINYIKEYSKNGESEVIWQRTIDNNSVVISNDRPIYVDLITCKNNIDENNMIRMIHKYILNEAVTFFKKLDLIECNIDIDEYCELPIDDKFYILQILSNKLNTEFIDRNIRLVKAMKIFFNSEDNFNNENSEINIYGTREYEYIWESVCSNIFNNKYLKSIDKIEKPVFKKNGCNTKNETKGTLTPDVVTYDDKNDILYIFDAKYYDFYFNSIGKIIGNYPDTYDIVKQLAYEDKLRERNISENIRNIFIIPTLNRSEIVGQVNYNLFNTSGIIEILKLNVKEAYDKFLNDEIISINF